MLQVTNPTVLLLQQARALIAEPEHWTQNTIARDKDGYPLPANHSRAVAFCAMGALLQVDGKEFPDCISPAVDAAMDALNRTLDLGELSIRVMPNVLASYTVHGGRNFTILNDFGTHAEVLAMFDKAIEMELVAA